MKFVGYHASKSLFILRCNNLMILQSKRGVFDVLAAILEILLKEECNKTKLASSANLATRSFMKYIDTILTFNLAAKSKAKNYFKITEKGKIFLEEYKKLKMFVQE